MLLVIRAVFLCVDWDHCGLIKPTLYFEIDKYLWSFIGICVSEST